MKVCFPVAEMNGLESEVYGHFGSAPMFLVVDTMSNDVAVIPNGNKDHAQGACNPLKSLNNERVDAIVVGGIGAGALNKLNQQGIKVFQAQAQTVKENVQMLSVQNLPEFTIQQTCAGHGHGMGCGH